MRGFILALALAACTSRVGNEEMVRRGSAHVGGVLAGATGEVRLILNEDQELILTDDGPFSFPQPLLTGAAFRIRVVSTTNRHACTVECGEGVVPATDDIAPAMVRCMGTARVSDIALGNQFSCALLESGQVTCWGRNDQGMLGVGDTHRRGGRLGEMGDRLPRVALGTGRSAIAISAAGDTACAILDNQQVKCWGRGGNRLGLGLGGNSMGDYPGEMGDQLPTVQLGTGRFVTDLTSGIDNHHCAILDTGQVKCWGGNARGKLGTGDTLSRGNDNALMGDNLPAALLGTGRTASAVATGFEHNCAILDTGEVKCWGRNDYGQLGLGDTVDRGLLPTELGDNLPVVQLGGGRTARSIDAGEHHTCVLLDNDELKCWGRNNTGQLGLGDNLDRGNEPGEMGDSLAAVALGSGKTAIALTVGLVHTCALLDNGEAKCWGANGFGQLGQGDTDHRGNDAGEMGDNLPPISIGDGLTVERIVAGYNFSCVVLASADVKCWGVNDRGQLGLGDLVNRGDRPAASVEARPLALSPLRRTIGVAAGGTHACAHSDSGEIQCWGDNLNGQLGLGDNQDRTEPALLSISAVSSLTTGREHTCALLNTGRVRCWGHNGSGQLAVGDIDTRGNDAGETPGVLPNADLGVEPITVLVAGSYFNCAAAAGRAKCWGENGNGQLGAGHTTDLGGTPGQLGDALPEVDLGSHFDVADLAAGDLHACALSPEGVVKCWGRNNYGQLGLGNGDDRGNNPGQMGDTLPAVQLGTGRRAVDIAAGFVHTCVILDTGDVKCWGGTAWGQLGLGLTNHRGNEPLEMGDSLPTVPLGTGRVALAISAGGYHTCALLDSHEVKCWGRNTSGQLGQNDLHSRGVNACTIGDHLPPTPLAGDAVQVTTGDAFTCVLRDSGHVVCWGENLDGQLGQGDTRRRGAGRVGMGDDLPAVLLAE